MKKAKLQNQESNIIRERGNQRERFEIIPNYHLYDKRLTMAEKGFLTMLYILPNNWKITQRATANYFNINKNTFTKNIKRLIELGYIELKKTAKNKATYIIKEQSNKAPFDPTQINNYSLEHLNKFLNDSRIEERYKNLIRKAIKGAEQVEEHFKKMMEEIDQETKAKKGEEMSEQVAYILEK